MGCVADILHSSHRLNSSVSSAITERLPRYRLEKSAGHFVLLEDLNPRQVGCFIGYTLLDIDSK